MKANPRDISYRIWAVGMVVAVLLLVSHLLIARPLGAKYRHKLQSLRLEQIRTLRLQTDVAIGNEYVTRERVLTGNDVSRFLALLAEAKTCASNHRSGGWVCIVAIDTTTDIPRFSFIVRSTGRHGVQFDLKPSGWAYGGTLRNDALGPFIEAFFRNSQSETPN
jgi:hypothetical protein